MKLVPLVVVGLLLSGCGAALAPGEGLPDGRTFLSESVTEQGEPRPLVAGTRIRLSFSGDTVRADAGCNLLSGTARMDGDRLVVTNLGGTEMGCDEPRMAQDDWLIEFLGGRPVLALDGDVLTLSDSRTVIRLSDRRIADPDRPLRGTRWEVDTLVDGAVASSLPAGVSAYLTFTKGGQVTGYDGCNLFSGRYEVRDLAIIVSELISATRHCAGDAGVVGQSVLDVLREEMTYRIEARRLMLDTASGKGLGLRAK